MIQSGAVSLARLAGRFSLPWIAASSLLFILQVVYPAAKIDLEASAWTSLSSRPDSLLASFILDGTLSWLGLTLGFLVSGWMYAMALSEWRGGRPAFADLGRSLPMAGQFVQLGFWAALMQGLCWYLVSSRLPPLNAVAFQLLITSAAITPFLFTVPLIVDRRLTAVQAIRTSFRQVSPHPLSAFFLLLTAGIWSQMGGVLFGLGAILTLPIYQRAVSYSYLALPAPDEPDEVSAKHL